ncbi:hypothetical protein [Cupriavidus alkaliphilus]|uniref:hypothetical protein n=1 Tax=Cupriavidus alkaliphilus TaxID=942866 RepID=UPI00161DBAD9|nr:hypothetical protein [Cupriavidus alkaliphilus]MBB2917171.1 hypothetical protein [Cupriavidus alkaliphilus]MBB3015339.1 hypothetical protein [Cupriavidus alkaliphilus]
MNTVTTLPRAGRATARSQRKGWFDSLADEAVSFFKGDNNAPWAILAETVIGCVPVLGQVIDARDIIKGLVEVSGAPASPAAWFNLITALIGVVPGGGDATKRSLRAIKSGTASIDSLLDLMRKFGKGDPEKFLREMMDPSKLQKLLDDMLNNPALRRQLSPSSQRQLDSIRNNLTKQFGAFKREIDGWLTRGRKTSAEAPAIKPNKTTPPAKPRTEAKGGTKTKADANDATHTNQTKSSELARRTLGQLKQKALGVLGEHMADYHCQEVKCWGERAKHDNGKKNQAKLNDGSELVQLWPLKVRGRGIDAVWKSNGHKPYAIIEAKASYDPTKTLASLLRDLSDKTGKDAESSSSSRSGRRQSKQPAPGSGAAAATAQAPSRTPMSKYWIEHRIANAVRSPLLARTIILKGYTRHVLFFSVPQAVSHAQSLLMHLADKKVDVSMHSGHQATREWTDNQIQKLADGRLGLTGVARKR